VEPALSGKHSGGAGVGAGPHQLRFGGGGPQLEVQMGIELLAGQGTRGGDRGRGAPMIPGNWQLGGEGGAQGGL